jgi:hypothetical protein
MEAAPSFRTSTRCRALAGIMLVSTNVDPSLAVAAARVLRRPLTSTRVEPSPRPRRLTLLVPWVAPDVKESGTFSDPELTVR